MRILFTVLIVCFPGLFLLAQGGGGVSRQVLVESLKEEARLSISDAKKAELFMRLSELYGEFKPDTSIFYGEKALVLARNTKRIKTEIATLGFIAGALLHKGNYPKALELCLEADQIREDNILSVSNEPLGIGPAYVNMVLIFEHIGEYEKALYYSKKMSNFPKSGIINLAFGNYYLARTYEKMNKLDSAIISLNESLLQFSSLGDSLKDYYGIHPELYNLRAYIHLKQNQPALALNDFNESLKLSREGDFIPFIANTLIDLSNYYKSIEQSDSVVFYADKALKEANSISFTKGILNASEILADAYKGRDLEKAFYYYQMATETRTSLYGAGNIQVIRDMIFQNEQRQEDLLNAEEAYQNKLRQYLLFAGLIGLLLVAFILYRSNKRSKASNIILSNTLDNLKSTQKQLIQSEKMASLGELTAGIAHEIQNPLNFVNNFSEVSEEMLEEMEEEIGKGDLKEIKAISSDLKQNLQKIHHHGNRASSIVKGMLEHSQTSTGEKVPTDINALADEYLRLAYHGLRAKDKDFNADFKTDFDESLPKVNVIPQDIGRVLLNLINNSFQAVTERSRSVAKSDSYKPLVTISTKLTANSQLLIVIKDNGSGIPDTIKDKIFQPFFTTKPTGKGTGLGLSLAYDIVKAHGGELTLESPLAEKTEEGLPAEAKAKEGSIFIVKLPII